MDENLHALFAVRGDSLAETVEAGDAVPFGVHDPVAVLVAHHTTFREAGGRGGPNEIRGLPVEGMAQETEMRGEPM